MEYVITLGYRDGAQITNISVYRRPSDLAVGLNRMQSREIENICNRLGFTTKGVDYPFGYVYWVVRYSTRNRWLTYQLGGRAIPCATDSEQEKVAEVVKSCKDYYSVRYGYSPFLFNGRQVVDENPDSSLIAEEDAVAGSRPIMMHLGAKAKHHSGDDNIIRFTFSESGGAVSVRMCVSDISDNVFSANAVKESFKKRYGVEEAGNAEDAIGELTWRFKQKSLDSCMFYTRSIGLFSKGGVSAEAVKFMNDMVVKVAKHMDCCESIAAQLGLPNSYTPGRIQPDETSHRTIRRLNDLGGHECPDCHRAITPDVREIHETPAEGCAKPRSKYAAKLARRMQLARREGCVADRNIEN